MKIQTQIEEAELIPIIKSRVSKYLPGFGEDYKMEIDRIKAGSYTNAFVCKVSNENNRHRFFLKTKLKTPSDRDTYLEYHILRRLWNDYDYSKKTKRIPRPIDYISELNLLVTEFYQGESLSHFLRMSILFPVYNFRVNAILKELENVALWLSEYEKQVFDGKVEKLNLHSRYYIEEKIDDISFLTERLKDSIKKSLYELSSQHTGIPVHLVNTDFNPYNMIIVDGSLMVTDWEKTKTNGLSFWMLSTFSRYLDRLYCKYGIVKRGQKKIIKHFEDAYWKNTIFSDHRNLYPVVRAMESITSLAESERSINMKKPNKVDLQHLENVLSSLSINH